MTAKRFVRIVAVELGFDRVLRTAGHLRRVRPTLLVELTDAHGYSGWGECARWPEPGPDDADALATAADHWIADATVPSGPGPIAAAFELAAADLAARRDRLPLATWLAREAGTIRRVPSAVDVNATLDASADADAAHDLDALDGGIEVVKCKVGATAPNDDIDRLVRLSRLSVVRERRLRFRLDANGAWDAPTAIAVLLELADAEVPVEFVEQPTPPGDLVGMAAVRAAVNVPVIADESVTTIDDLESLIAADACDGVMLKLARCGGPQTTGALAAAARRHGLLVCWSSSFESAVGVLGGLHAAAAYGADAACGFATSSAFGTDVAEVPPVSDGTIALARTAGIGIDPEL